MLFNSSDRQIEQCHRESRNPCIYVYVICDGDFMSHHLGNDWLLVNGAVTLLFMLRKIWKTLALCQTAHKNQSPVD